MADKFAYWAVIALLVIFGLGIILYAFAPLIFDGYEPWEFYARMCMIFLAVIAIGIVLLRNAVYHNTKVSTYLAGALKTIAKYIPGVERLMTELRTTINYSDAKIEALRKSVDALNNSTRELQKLLTEFKTIDLKTDKSTKK